MNEQPKVIINCLVYNHEPYLRDCLEGFVMQQTNFPFKAVVHDDASTDNSAAIIREYAEKYPHIIEPIYETENQYSKHDGSIRRIMYEATLKNNPYVAYCEGDDYWIDPLKLQKQVDYMDAHPECTMTCSNAKVLKQDGWMLLEEKKKRDWFHHDISRELTAKDFLFNSGYTCTLVFRSEIIKKQPEVCLQCAWEDFAIKVYAALKGTTYCFEEYMGVYRALSIGSYTSRMSNLSQTERLQTEKSLLNMLEYLNEYSNHQYENSFNERIYTHATHALLSDNSEALTLCRKYGYIFLKYPQMVKKNQNIIKYWLRKIKWFPFKPGIFTKYLKRISFIQRIHITYICIKSYIQAKKNNFNSHLIIDNNDFN